MEIDKIIVGLFSFFGIVLTYWFFLLRKEESVFVEKNEVDILVEGGYKPENIIIPQNKTTTVNFLRKDESSCLEEVVLSDFKIKKFLPVNKTVSFDISPREKGEFPFSCGMNMFHGKIIVR